MRRTRSWLFLIILCMILPLRAQQSTGIIVIEARGESGPAQQVEVQAGGQIAVTDSLGKATLELPPGDVEVQFRRVGFASKTLRATVIAGQTVRLSVELKEESVVEEEVLVTATRANIRIEDEP